MEILPNHIITRNEEPLSSEIDGERVMMSIEQGKYFGLNTVGSFIWEVLEQKPTLELLLEEVEKKYEVDASTCKTETIAFLKQLLDKHLIKIEKQ